MDHGSIASPGEMGTVYRFDPSRLDLAREYKARPFGEHSPDLQYLLNLMRTRETEGRYVLVMTRPHAQWTLARLTRAFSWLLESERLPKRERGVIHRSPVDENRRRDAVSAREGLFTGSA
jgi:hypothetical protein